MSENGGKAVWHYEVLLRCAQFLASVGISVPDSLSSDCAGGIDESVFVHLAIHSGVSVDDIVLLFDKVVRLSLINGRHLN